MAANTLRFKKLGFHFLPTNDLLIARLRTKLQSSATTDDDSGTNHSFFPIIDKKLYSAEPWKVFEDDDPWEISNSGEKIVTRKIYIFTTVKLVGAKKRAVRVAGKGTWAGSTGEKDVKGETGSLIGKKSSFEFKTKQDPEDKNIHGHWSMNEYKVLDSSNSSTANSIIVLCQITHVVDKATGNHLSWPKTPFKLYFDKFKERGVFLKKRKQPEPANHEHHQEVDEEAPTSSAPRTLITNQDTADFAIDESEDMVVDRDDDHRTQENQMDHEGSFNDHNAQENQPVLYDDESGVNDESCRPVDQNPNLGAAETPSCSYGYAADDGNSYYDHQVGGSLSRSLLLSNGHMMVSGNENMGMENQLGMDNIAQPQLDHFDVHAPKLRGIEQKNQSVELMGTNQVKRDDDMVVEKDDENEELWSEIESLDMAKPQLDPFDGYSLWERMHAPNFGTEENNKSVELGGIDQMMMSSLMETPSVFDSAADGYSYYNEGVGKENVVEVDGQQQNGSSSREVDQSLGLDEEQQQYGVTSSNENNKVVEVKERTTQHVPDDEDEEEDEDEQGPSNTSTEFNYEEFVEKMQGEYKRYSGLNQEERQKYGLMTEDDNVFLDVKTD